MVRALPRPPLPPGPFLIVGLARSGTAAALTLAARGEQVIGVDAGSPDGAKALSEGGLEVRLQEDGTGLLERVGTLVKSPGVPAQAPVLVAARERGTPVLGELELGWRMLGNEFIAVTGTNGKTTTVELIGHIHRQAGREVEVAGNVGAPVSGLVDRVAPDATIVCEASSFQLEDSIEFAPEAAVLVNLTLDHLDRHGTPDAYAQAKLNAFARQREGDVAVAPSAMLARAPGGEAGPLSEIVSLTGATRVGFGSGAEASLRERDGELWWEGERLLARGEVRLRGSHNLENAMAAAAVCLARGIEADAVRAGLRSFTGVAHRLEEIATRDGVTFINDSKATNVQSTLVALEALAEGGGVHVILGGQGKGQDFTPLRDAIEHRCRAVYLIGEDGPLIGRALEGSSVPVHSCGELEAAVTAAERAAAAGEVVLLSPACASFDQFVDFEARGERFRALVGL